MKIYKKDIADELTAIPEFKDIDMILRFGKKCARKENLIIRLEKNLIYDDNVYRYFCTHCQTYHDDSMVKVGKHKTCPNCHTKLKVATKRNKIVSYVNMITYAQKNKRNELIFRVFKYERYYNKETMNFYENAFEVIRINVDHDVRIIRNNYVVYYTINFKQGKSDWKRFLPSYFKYYYIDFTFNFCNRSLKNILKGTKFEYSCLDKVINRVNVMDYLTTYSLFPALEMIVKANMTNMMNFCIRNITSKKSAEKVTDFLMKNKKFFKIWSKLNPTAEQMTAMANLDTFDIEYANNVMKKGMQFHKQDYVDDKKLAKYLVRSNGDFTIWSDYIDFLERLEFKMNKSNIFPSDLMEAHDKIFNKTKVLDNKKYEQDIIDFENMIRPYNYKDDNFTIYCARTVEELIDESAKMEHCVRDYIPKISHHQSAIFLLRKNENIEESYVTVEIDPVNKVLLQCRRKNNEVPDTDVMLFVKKWCESRIIDDSRLTFTV